MKGFRSALYMRKKGILRSPVHMAHQDVYKRQLYHEKDGIWEGGSTSQFSPVMTFKLGEKFSNNFLEVSESMEVNGKRTFGYDEPIIYKRV